MAEPILTRVYLGRNSPREVTISLKGAPVDFVSTGVSRMGLELDGVEYFSDDGYLSYGDGGVVTFTLGDIPNPPTRRARGSIYIYSDQYPKGRPIITDKTSAKLDFEFYAKKTNQ